jgi:hypothetical protein
MKTWGCMLNGADRHNGTAPHHIIKVKEGPVTGEKLDSIRKWVTRSTGLTDMGELTWPPFLHPYMLHTQTTYSYSGDAHRLSHEFVGQTGDGGMCVLSLFKYE